jgi:hypothetical protein
MFCSDKIKDGEIDGHVAGMGTKENHAKFYSKNLKPRDHLGVLGRYKYTCTWALRVCTGFNWLRI